MAATLTVIVISPTERFDVPLRTYSPTVFTSRLLVSQVTVPAIVCPFKNVAVSLVGSVGSFPTITVISSYLAYPVDTLGTTFTVFSIGVSQPATVPITLYSPGVLMSTLVTSHLTFATVLLLLASVTLSCAGSKSASFCPSANT